MALLDEAKQVLRVSSEAMDSEVQMLIDAALNDLRMKGVNPAIVSEATDVPLVKQCVMLYCKCHFGYDNQEADRFGASYRQAVIDLLCSRYNVEAVRRSMADAVVSSIPDQAYTGHTVRPVPTVTYDGTALTQWEDFTVSYKGNVGPGTAVATVTGTGTYKGSVNVGFEIV